MKTFLAVVASTLLATAAVASTLPPSFDDNPTVIDAVAKARGTGKPVIVYFTDHNCHACGALDGWLVRSDIRQAYAGAYHFSMVFGDDLTSQERERWKATYIPRGAPSWVVLAADGSYLCTASGGFVNATEALKLHEVLTRASNAKFIEAPTRPRPCSARALGLPASEQAGR